jgi:hypothetical protein
MELPKEQQLSLEDSLIPAGRTRPAIYIEMLARFSECMFQG